MKPCPLLGRSRLRLTRRCFPQIHKQHSSLILFTLFPSRLYVPKSNISWYLVISVCSYTSTSHTFRHLVHCSRRLVLYFASSKFKVSRIYIPQHAAPKEIPTHDSGILKTVSQSQRSCYCFKDPRRRKSLKPTTQRYETYVRTTNRKTKRTRICIICGFNAREAKGLRNHFVVCVEHNGNPNGVRWDDALQPPAMPAGPVNMQSRYKSSLARYGSSRLIWTLAVDLKKYSAKAYSPEMTSSTSSTTRIFT